MRSVVGMAALLLAALVCMDASAMCGGGGMVSGGGRGISVSGASGARASARPEKKLDKAALPAAAEIASLDTAVFDRTVTALKLSDEQLKRIDAAKAEIRDVLQTLAKQQAEARGAYQKSADAQAYLEAARNVTSTASACKNYDPNRKFESALMSVLSLEQRVKYRELSRQS